MRPPPQSVTCPLCPQSGTRALWREPGYTLLACNNCGLAFRDSLPDERQYDGPDYFREYLESEPLFRSFFDEILEIVAAFKRPPGRLLDVGCSVGLLLQVAAERGWRATGVDVAPWAVEYARARGLDARLAKLDASTFPPQTFDVVVLNHVLEHVPDPVALLQVCRAILAPGGVLFVGAPNFGSLMARIEKERWPALQPDEHVWQFSPHTLGALLRRHGFRPRRCVTGLQPRNYTWGPKDLVKRALYPLAARMRGGEVMSVVATTAADQ